MRKLAILTFQTLDGVMQAPGDPEEDFSNGFSHGGWAKEYWEEVMKQVQREAMAEPYDLLLGGSTYNIFFSHFSNVNADNLIANKFKSATKYVVTSRSEPLTWENSLRIKGDLITEITNLKESEGPLLQVHGSWQLLQFLLSNNFVDELRLWTFPLVVGSGKRLFSDKTIAAAYKLTRFKSSQCGAYMNFYSPIGESI